MIIRFLFLIFYNKHCQYYLKFFVKLFFCKQVDLQNCILYKETQKINCKKLAKDRKDALSVKKIFSTDFSIDNSEAQEKNVKTMDIAGTKQQKILLGVITKFSKI